LDCYIFCHQLRWVWAHRLHFFFPDIIHHFLPHMYSWSSASVSALALRTLLKNKPSLSIKNVISYSYLGVELARSHPLPAEYEQRR
jgi:hypothetical protein